MSRKERERMTIMVGVKERELTLVQAAQMMGVCYRQSKRITLYAINPLTLQKFREAFVTSRAKDDSKDADYLADLLLSHHDKLQAWAPDDAPTCRLQQLIIHRRAVVDERTGLTNRLQALLKQYFPQALDVCGEDLWRPGHCLSAQMAHSPGAAEGPAPSRQGGGEVETPEARQPAKHGRLPQLPARVPTMNSNH